MSSSIKSLEAEALLLPPEQRVRLADHLLASLSGTVEVDDAWAAELERRIAESRRVR
jgi:putative addiction module component (TIGR02574 family)